MQRVMLVIVALLYCLMGASSLLAQQWAPVTSNIKVVLEMTNTRGEIHSETKEGAFYRNSEGSTLTRFTKINGIEKRGIGQLFDKRNSVTYQLLYEAGKAMEGPVKPERIPPDLFSKIQPIGHDSVDGISCNVIQINLKRSANAPEEQIGSQCVSPEYGLMLKQETNVTRPDGTRVHAVTRMFNIQMNLAPDPKLFDLQ